MSFIRKGTTVTISCLALVVSGCGGGGSSGNSGRNSTWRLLDSFADGSGVIRGTFSDDGTEITLTAIVPEAEQIAGTPVDGDLGAEELDFTPVGDPRGDIADGFFQDIEGTVNGTPLVGTVYIGENQAVTIVNLEAGGVNVLAAGGEAIPNVPSGLFTYSGGSIIKSLNENGDLYEEGLFTMSVDFDEAEITAFGAEDIGGDNGVYLPVDGPTIPVNMSTGEFEFDGLGAYINEGALESGMTIQGTFHGDGATGVSGVFYDNDPTPNYGGAIAGTGGPVDP